MAFVGVFYEVAEFVYPLVKGSGEVAIVAILDDFTVDADGGDDGGAAEGHILEGFEAALAPGPGVIRQGHETNIYRGEVGHFGIRLPREDSPRSP